MSFAARDICEYRGYLHITISWAVAAGVNER